MQWSKVKNILLGILLAVNLFLAWVLGLQYQQTVDQQAQLRRDIAIVLQQQGVACAESLTIPLRCSAVELTVETNLESEESFVNALLSDAVRNEKNDSNTSYTGQEGTVVWKNDGSIYAKIKSGSSETPPQTERAIKQQAKSILKRCGISIHGGDWTIFPEQRQAVFTTTVAGHPVFGRALSLTFDETGGFTIRGRWSFGTPYARTADRERTYEAGNALLRFARKTPEVQKILDMKFGYSLQTGAAGRLQMIPVWRFQTDAGVFLVDCTT